MGTAAEAFRFVTLAPDLAAKLAEFADLRRPVHNAR
jgi:hypothetical protein